MKPAVCYLLLLFLVGCQNQPLGNMPVANAVAHAGGGVDGKRYSNSIQALNYNYERGFHLFELDFSWTKDGHLVCLHDWDRTPKWLLNYKAEKPLSLEEFRMLRNEKLNLQACDLESLNDWLKTHPKAYIVTHIKSKNIKGLTAMLTEIDDATHRVIPQFTQPEHYTQIKTLGYDKLIWTLFSYKEDNDAVVKEARAMNLFAITMPKKRAESDLAKMIQPLKIPTYVHTVNDLEKALEYQTKHGLTSIYTDFLEANFSASD